jgi:hypothetical protein
MVMMFLSMTFRLIIPVLRDKGVSSGVFQRDDPTGGIGFYKFEKLFLTGRAL